MSWERLEALGWRPATPFSDGLAITLAWYRDHLDWVDEVLQRAHAGVRIARDRGRRRPRPRARRGARRPRTTTCAPLTHAELDIGDGHAVHAIVVRRSART